MEITNATSGGGATGLYLTATVKCNTTSDIGRLIIAYADSSNYWFCEVQPGATNGTLKLFQRSGGVNTQQGPTQTVFGLQATNTATVFLCVGGGYVRTTAYKTLGTNASISFAASPTITSKAAGVGTGAGTSNVKFDDFTYSKSEFESATCPDCPGPSNCSACSTDTASSYTITISGLTNGTCGTCSSLSGTYSVPYLGSTCNGGGFSVSTSCGTLDIQWSLEIPSAGADIQFHVIVTIAGFGTKIMNFIKVFTGSGTGGGGPGTIDCITISAMTIPWDNETGTNFCAGTAATVTATFVP